MSTENSRGKNMGPVLKMLRVMMEGSRLDAQQAAKLQGTIPEVALRNLKLLLRSIPGVRREKVGAKHVFSFDPGQAFAKSLATEERAPLARVISASLGAAFSKVFTGTQYQVELEAIRTDVVHRLATMRRQQFSSMNRKFVVLCSHEASLADRAGDLDDALDAILSQRVVRIQYRTFSGKNDVRRIKPYSLVIHDAQLYVVGVDADAREDQAPRTYRFARILTIDIEAERFEYPEQNEYDPAVLFRDSVGIWLGEPEPCQVRVRLSSYWATYARHHRWHQSQKSRALDDGTVEIELLIRPCPEFEQWILRFGEGAEVVEPTELRERVKVRLAKALETYANSASVVKVTAGLQRDESAMS